MYVHFVHALWIQDDAVVFWQLVSLYIITGTNEYISLVQII